MSTPLKIEREKRGITTEAVALAVGVKQPTVNRIENNKSQASPDLANRLAKYFGNAVTRDQILYPEDYAEPIRKPMRPRLQKAS